LETNCKSRFELWKKVAEEGFSQGQAMLGLCYLFGAFVPQDKTVGIEWLTKAAEQGRKDQVAQFLEMGEENMPAEGQ
jgi:TPR repeat protein